MKNRFYLLIAALLLGSGSVVRGQSYLDDPRYGATQADREHNVLVLNYFNGAVQEKDYNRATAYMRELIENAPKASENIYIRGVRIYEEKLMRSTSRDERKVFLDSLLWIHDQRIEAFGDHATRGEDFIRTAKAMDVHRLMKSDKRFVKLAEEALAGKVINPDLAVLYFNTLTESFRLDDITPEELMSKYTVLAGMLEKEGPKAKEALDAVENLFAASGAANCDNIEKIFKPQYEADPTNSELIEKILALLQRAQCSSPFYMDLLEKYYAVNPKPEIALQLAMYFQSNDNQEKGMEYLKIAIDGEQDPVQKGKFLLQAAGMSLQANAFRDAANFARQAIALDGENGYGYFLLANAYSGGAPNACGDAFNRQTVYWLVVDNLLQARKYLPEDDAQQESISRAMGTYVGNFPKTEETFMRGLTPGQGYTVSCGWISGRTTVRER